MKKIHYKVFLPGEYPEDEFQIIATGTIKVSKALKDHSLAWVEKEEKCTRKFFYHGNKDNVFFEFSFEALVTPIEDENGKITLEYSNCFMDDKKFEIDDVLVEEHVPDTAYVRKEYTALADVIIE